MTFYRAHRNLLCEAKIPSEHCLTVDASQGAEYDTGILSTGRRWASLRSVGFIADRRRITVAVSRWQRKLIVLLHHDIGKNDVGRGQHTCEGQVWWRNFRHLAADIGALYDAGDLYQADFSIVAQDIVSRLGTGSKSLDCGRIERAARSRADFFDTYQANVVGRMDAPLPLELSDDETELPEDIRTEILENTGNHESDAEDDLATPAPADPDDVPATWCPNFDMLWNTVRVKGPFATQVFCIVAMGKLNHFWKARTYFMRMRDYRAFLYESEPYQPPADVVLYEAMRSFATTLNWSLRQEYDIEGQAVDSEDAEARRELLQQTIHYPNTRDYTLQDLVTSESICYDFLRDLYGAAGRPFFSSFGRGSTHLNDPVKKLKNSLWELVLPYAIVHALVSRSANCEYRPTASTKKAPQYGLDAFVYNHWEEQWDRLRYLEHQARKRQRQEEDERECIVTFTPYNCTRMARLSREAGSGTELSDYFMSLDEMYANAFEKDAWWYRAFYR